MVCSVTWQCDLEYNVVQVFQMCQGHIIQKLMQHYRRSFASFQEVCIPEWVPHENLFFFKYEVDPQSLYELVENLFFERIF